MTRLPKLPPQLGDSVCHLIKQVSGQEADIILIAFPREGEGPQPQFISSFHPDIMESVLIQLAELLPEVRASRIFEESEKPS